MSGIPLPDFDFEDDLTLSFDSELPASPPLAPNPYIHSELQNFGFSLQKSAPMKCTSNSMVFCIESLQFDTANTVNNVPQTVNDNGKVLYALKVTSNRQRIFKEYENSQLLPRSPYLVKIFDIYDAGTSVLLQMELCARGDIANHKMNELEIWKLVHDVGNALAVIHQTGYMHMDVSPSNILMTSNSPEEIDNYEVHNSTVSANNGSFKLGDFGTLCELGQFEAGMEGAGPYVSPEALMFPGNESIGRVYVTEKTDIFSFGLVVLECATGVFAPRGGDPNYTRIRNGTLKLNSYNQEENLYSISAQQQNLSPQLIHLIDAMISCDPDERPSAQQIAEHPWAIEASKLCS